ncbi:MAG: glycoside hydrolase family 19 protein [Pseudomonadota bacterium]
MALAPVQLLQEMGVAEHHAAIYIDDLVHTLPAYGITESRDRLAHFFSQVLHESGMMRYDEENLNYSAKALRAVFPKYFTTLREANKYHRQPEKIANRVYGGRMGNGNEASGDGWRYRGRGLIQLTGKRNYQAFAEWVEDERVVEQPELVAIEYAVQSAVFYWDKNHLNKVADRNDVKAVTKKVNGGTNGLAHRAELYLKANGLLAMLDV